MELMNQLAGESLPVTAMPDPAWLRALPGADAMTSRKDSNSSDHGDGGDGAPIISLISDTSKTHGPDQIHLPQPVIQAGFDESLGDQVRWLCKQRIPVAHIDLEPAELGRLQVRISLDDDNARVHFVTQHRETRDLLEAAFPQLREALANDGIQLMDASVEQSPSGQGQGSAQLSSYWAGSDPAPEDDSVAATEAIQVSRIRSGSLGLVDLYI
jgi:flagellar hook-length control protein FliK